MRRADRLFQIILQLRRRKFATARELAQALEVSERTIYRDINELYCCGVPIDGAAGVGYRLRRGFDLPPMMFDRDELDALRFGARMIKAWADPALARAAGYALSKIEAALPEDIQSASSPLFALGFHPYPVQLLEPLRQAIKDRHKVRFAYTRKDGEHSERTVCPLGLFFWGPSWTLASWCELREDFRNFRLDRMANPVVTEATFDLTPGRSLADFLARECDDALMFDPPP